MSNEENNDYRRLEELGGSDYEIADGEPNIKGWDIKDNIGNSIGKVDELLFNPPSRKVRYLVAHLKERVFGVENRKVLIPIGHAELHDEEDEVLLPALTIAQLSDAPDYYKEQLNAETEIAARNAFITDAPLSYDEQTFYEHDHYNERSFYGRRFVDRKGDELDS